MLYWKDDIVLESCKVCGESRWKKDDRSGEIWYKSNGKRIGRKILRYFPLKPRLQRLFMSTKTSELMRWHHEGRVDDGVMRHPADSMALDHMRELWNRWRNRLYNDYVKSCETIEEALDNVPNGIEYADWEWLVRERFSSEAFQKASMTNAGNRSKRSTTLNPRTGSMPFREIMYNMGGKDGKVPEVSEMFLQTRKKKNVLPNDDVNKKYVEIKDVVQSQPTLSPLEVVEKCFGPQTKNHVTCFGGGLKPKDLKEAQSTRVVELETELRNTKSENEVLRSTVNDLQKDYTEFKDMVLRKMNNNISSPSTSFQDDYEESTRSIDREAL